MVRVPMSTAYWDTGGLITCWPMAFAESAATAATAAAREKGFMEFLCRQVTEDHGVVAVPFSHAGAGLTSATESNDR
jgi:hypothetical protein